jgi:hypothetical protein
MVAGEDAQAARILREHLGDPELGREVTDGAGSVRERLIPARIGQIALEIRVHRLEVLKERGVHRQLPQAARGHLPEQSDGVELHRGPQLGVHLGEEIGRVGVPGPPEIRHQFAECGEGLREAGADSESSKGSHVAAHYPQSGPVLIGRTFVRVYATTRYVWRADTPQICREAA